MRNGHRPKLLSTPGGDVERGPQAPHGQQYQAMISGVRRSIDSWERTRVGREAG